VAQKSLFRTPAVNVIPAADDDEMPLYLNVPHSGYVFYTNFPVLQHVEVALKTIVLFSLL
jgi:hypothetical protein